MTKVSLLAAACALACTIATPAQAQSEPYVADIMLVGFPYCPRNFMEASGQLLPIAQNQALFSLLGTQYGGNGTTNFALPNLNGRTLIHHGQGPGLPNLPQGATGGAETTTMTVQTMPSHTHIAHASGQAPNSMVPQGHAMATFSGVNRYADATPDTPLESGVITQAGGNQPFNNMAPFLTLRYCIAIYGIYPSRN